ncbi:hypothetical protein MGSAQ_003219, partial [marine sediment metagenome]
SIDYTRLALLVKIDHAFKANWTNFMRLTSGTKRFKTIGADV